MDNNHLILMIKGDLRVHRQVSQEPNQDLCHPTCQLDSKISLVPLCLQVSVDLSLNRLSMLRCISRSHQEIWLPPNSNLNPSRY